VVAEQVEDAQGYGSGLLTKVASGYWQVIDPQNGYTAISLKVFKVISMDEVYT